MTNSSHQFTKGEPKELIKHFFNDRGESLYSKTIAVLQKQYGTLNTFSSFFLKKQISPLKATDATVFRKLSDFFIKCQAYEAFDQCNASDTSKTMCMILTKIPPIHLQDR